MTSRVAGWALACGVLSWSAVALAASDAAERVRLLIRGLDFDEARQELSSADPNDLDLIVERARLALYELDCDAAAAAFDREELLSVPGAEELAESARGCRRAIAATTVDTDETGTTTIRWQNDEDRALAPWLFDAAARAKQQLTEDLGVDWPKPTRIVVVQDLLSLSAMTSLPYVGAATTGTVAVAKWGRVTILSPRATPHGYAWLDTVAHELTHLAVTRATRDLAPLWLQEGVAKLEEIRWRQPSPFDNRPSSDAIARRGFELGLGIPLDRLGPSIALLPSAEAARVAFAEVTSFVREYVSDGGHPALVRLLGALREGAGSNEALVAASGRGLAEWNSQWRANIASSTSESLPKIWDIGPSREPSTHAAREGVRVAELLGARGHFGEALARLDATPLPTRSTQDSLRSPDDPELAWLRAELLAAIGRAADGRALVTEPLTVSSSFGPWWALRGRLAREDGHGLEAIDSFDQARDVDPLSQEVACEDIEVSARPMAELGTLCDAARRFGAPLFDVE